jgi:hypothetical protein
VLFALSVNQGELVTREQCRWLAERLRRADRDCVLSEVPGPGSSLSPLRAAR